MGEPRIYCPVARPMGRRYCLITPCRDEARYIRSTLETTTRQSMPPALWVIVDDGSTDGTAEILAEYAAKHDYIVVVKREDRGARAVGPGVIEAFYDGLSHVDLTDFDYVCKFDGDLEMPPRYFERAMERMERDPYLGNVSGKLFERKPDGRLWMERTGDENAVGPAKFYRVGCFQEIGGFVREVSWDGIDGHLCRMNGWIAQSTNDPEMRIVHLRPMGSSQENIRVGRIRWGRGKYFMGSAPYYVLAVAAYRSMEPPWICGRRRHHLGLPEGRAEQPPSLRQPRLPALRPALRARTALHGQEARDGGRERAHPPRGSAQGRAHPVHRPRRSGRVAEGRWSAREGSLRPPPRSPRARPPGTDQRKPGPDPSEPDRDVGKPDWGPGKPVRDLGKRHRILGNPDRDLGEREHDLGEREREPCTRGRDPCRRGRDRCKPDWPPCERRSRPVKARSASVQA